MNRSEVDCIRGGGKVERFYLLEFLRSSKRLRGGKVVQRYYGYGKEEIKGLKKE